MLKLNKRFISQELKKNKLKHSVGAVQALEPLLRRQVCNACCFYMNNVYRTFAWKKYGFASCGLYIIISCVFLAVSTASV